ncbi:MAG: hypothetical protein ACHQUC_03390 [Chlamydiales bacterium]
MENNSDDKKQNQCCSISKKCCCSSPKCALLFSGALFGIVSLIHLYRLFYFFPVTIGTVAVPPAASTIAFIVFGLLSIWMFCSACKVSKSV